MTTPNHHDPNYFKQRINSKHSTDIEEMERCYEELIEIVSGINKGLKVLESVGKYPDKQVVDNKVDFEHLLEEYQAHLEYLRKHTI